MVRFNYKGGCGVHGHIRIETIKRKLAWATDKRLQVISTITLFNHTTKKLKNKVVLSLFKIVCIAMWSLVTNCLVIY